jgi:maltose alpha-D-glucosyltransferase/alpha-amylase
VNVEAQQDDQSSLLNWMRNMIALRKLFQVFGRGTLKFLEPENRKVLAYLRQLDGQTILCVANLSRFAQPVQLDLAEMDGMIPVEMLGYVEFPKIGKQPYPLTLAPYGFLWLELQPAAPSPVPEIETAHEAKLSVSAPDRWQELLSNVENRSVLEGMLFAEFLPRQRWFGAKSRRIASTTIVDWGVFDEGRAALVMLRVTYTEGEADLYLVPLGMSFGTAAEQLREISPAAVLSSIATPRERGVLRDGLWSESTLVSLLSFISNSAEVQLEHGIARGLPSSVLPTLRGGEGELHARRSSAEQSNSSILYGDKLILKLFRRQQPGLNPDTEIGRYLTEHTTFRNIAPFGGSIEYAAGEDTHTFAMLQGLVANEGDGWQWTLDELDRYYDAHAGNVFPASEAGALPSSLLQLSETVLPKSVLDAVGFYLNAASTLGRRTGELHVALAAPSTDPAFAPEPFTAEDARRLREPLLANASQAFDALKENLANLPDDTVEAAGLVLSRRRTIFERLREVKEAAAGGLRIRIHGDYHLGQVLRTKSDFVILDFEGEPAKPLEARRGKHSPLKDVAGMLRSFSYASAAALTRVTTRRPQDAARLEPWARLWEQAVMAEFLKAYREATGNAALLPLETGVFENLLEACVMEKALYELLYELNNRPGWVRIPLQGILSLSQ